MKKISFALLVIICAYFFVAGQQLHLPGLHNDEAQEAGLPALQMANGSKVSAFRNIGIGPRHFPLMVQDYIGALHAYFTVPFVTALGPNATSVRLPALIIGAITLVLTFSFTRLTWGNGTALLSAVLLALHPSFVFWSRQGTLIASVTLAFAMALLWAITQWCKHGTARWAFLAGLLAGVGVYSKIIFLWILGGMAGSTLLLNLHRMLTARKGFWPRNPTLSSIVAVVAGFSIGITPLLTFHTLSHGAALRPIGQMFSADTAGWSQLLGRLDHFGAVLTAKNHFWYLGSSPGNSLWLWAFALASLAIIIQFALGFRHGRRGFALFILLILAVLVASFTPTPAGLFPHHLALFTPLWATLVAVGSTTIARMTRQNRLAYILIALSLTALIAGDLKANLHMHRDLAKSGGEGPHSDAIHILTAKLVSIHPMDTVALDWGIAPQVRYLSGERIAPREIFGYGETADDGFGKRLQLFFQKHGTVYLLHTPSETIFQRRTEFIKEATNLGYTLQKLDVVRNRNGIPIFELFIVNKQ